MTDESVRGPRPATRPPTRHRAARRTFLDAFVELPREAARSQGLRDGVQIHQQLVVSTLPGGRLRLSLLLFWLSLYFGHRSGRGYRLPSKRCTRPNF